MEMGSGSMTDSDGSSTNSSTESLNGLKFGQKIYFENTSATGVGASPPKSGPGSSSSSGSGKKPRGGMVQSAPPPRCQVEGCKVDLSDAKAYYSRHKVCGMHSKASNVIVAGLEQRFCQQCSRHSTRDVWSTSRSSENVSANQNTATGWSLPHPWQNNLEDPPPNFFLQGTAAGTCSSTSTAGIPPGVVDSNSALSLLSNQPWGSRNQALTLGVGVNDMINTEVSSSVSQQAMPRGALTNPYSNASWGFKGNYSGSSSDEIPPHLGLAQFSEPINSQFSGRRQYMELELSNEDDTSMQHIHHTL